MNAGPNMKRALASWGAEIPDWVKVLAARCDVLTQGAVGREIERSSAVVNQVLSRSYRGRMDLVEQLVRGRYMKAIVDCPVLGQIPKNDCVVNQQLARRFKATNPLRVKLFQACAGCPNREGACSKS